MAQPILTRESDGLRFEPCYHPGMVRCEACLELCEPSAIKQHKCKDWWNEMLTEPTPFERGVLDRYNTQPVFRRSRH